jgi:hypothetical protein
MDWRRVVELYCPRDGARGSGYLVAPGLVLTASHVVSGADGEEVEVRFLEPTADGLPGDVGPWNRARVAWAGTGIDAALLVPSGSGSSFRDLTGTVGLGRVDGRAAVRVDATGFPRALATASHTDTLHIEADADPLTGLRARALHLQARTARPAGAEGWKGMSGSAVFAGDRLVGVLEAVPAALADSALRATPAHLLIEDADAGRLLASAGVDLSARLVDASSVEALPRAGHWDTVRATYANAVVEKFCRLDRVGYAVAGLPADRLPALAAFEARRFTADVNGEAATVRTSDLALHQRLVIVGPGGSGKSTILKQMLARAAGGARPLVPLWVPLAGLPAEGRLTEAVLAGHLVKQAGGLTRVRDVSSEFFASLLDEGAAVIGFDALDETGPLHRSQRVRDFILDVASQWPQCRVIVTARPDAYREVPLQATRGLSAGSAFVKAEVEPFERDDIEPFLRLAFEDGERLAARIAAMPDIEALTDTPLTLTLVGLVAGTGGELPSTRTDLFRKCLQTVVETWDQAKDTVESGDGLEPGQRLDVLRRLGWEAQQLGRDRLELAEARTAIKASPEVASPAAVRKVLDGLSRRSVVLLPDLGPGAIPELRGVTFAHAQFREYLAGAHLAAWFVDDADAARAALAPSVLDSRWFDTLAFAATSLDGESAARDALLEAVVGADDPLGDLLAGRREVVAALLLARVPGADRTIVAEVASMMARLALGEPALTDETAAALFGLSRLAGSADAIEALASAGDSSQRTGDGQSATGGGPLALFTRLEAITALAAAGRPARALELLDALQVDSVSHEIEASMTRAGIGDTTGAIHRLETIFNQREYRSAAVTAMNAIGATGTAESWLAALVADVDTLDPSTAGLARHWDVLADTSPVWPVLFDRAAAGIRALAPSEHYAPSELSDAVFLAFDLVEQSAHPSAANLLRLALVHPAFTWIVGPRLRNAVPEEAANALRAMYQYVLVCAAPETRMDGSRLNVVFHALLNEPDAGLARPVLLDLVDGFPLEAFRFRWEGVVNALKQRGWETEALSRLKRLFDAAPPGQASPGDRARGLEIVLLAAERISPETCYAWLNARYRASGNPRADADGVKSADDASGIQAVASGWFASALGDEGGREFLRGLTDHGPDTWFTDWARHTLYGNVFADDDDPPREASAPTAEQVERRLADIIETGRVYDENDRRRRAEARDVVGALLDLADVAGRETAERRAEAWLRGAISGETTATPKQVDELEDRLYALQHSRLRSEKWLAMAATVARSLPASARSPLVRFLRAHA